MKNNPIVYLTLKLWRFSHNNRKKVMLYVGMFLCSNAIGLTQPLIVAVFLNATQKAIQEHGLTYQDLPHLMLLLSLLLVRELGFWFFHGPARIIENENAFLTKANYRNYLLKGVMELPLEWHLDHHSGDTIDKIQRGSNSLFNYSGDTFRVIEAVLCLIGSFIALSYFNLGAGCITLFMVALTITIIVKFDKVLVEQYKVLNKAENKIAEKITDAITNITTVVILRIERLLLKGISRKITEPFDLYRKNIRVNEWKWFLVSLNTKITTVLVIGWYLFVSAKDHSPIMIGTVFALYGYVNGAADMFYSLAGMYGDLLRQKAALLNADELSKDFHQSGKGLGNNDISGWNEIKIESLAFSYHTEEGADLHLDGVSLTIKRGQRIALIGETGSGKTTLLKIMRELYPPQRVKVFVDGRLIPDGFSSISSEITLIPQEPEIFATTIWENITMGVDYSADEVKKYTDMAHFTDVAEHLPKKFDSSIVEKGVNLSGGEKQRLALARGLLACEDKSIVFLDEPTSSVDVTNELAIYRNIFKEFRDKVIVSSIHRLYLLPLFDMIYLFSDGKIVSSGTLAELLQQSDEFRRIWTEYSQANSTS